MDKFTNLRIGKIIHISKTFESHDGTDLNNRFMCVLSIEKDNILLLPMSTFHSQKIKNKKLSYKNVFEYSKIHGNTRDAYIKCDQIYVLSKEDLNIMKEIKMKHQMNDEYFEKLSKHVQTLRQKNQIKLIKKIIFKDPDGLIKKEQINEADYEYE